MSTQNFTITEAEAGDAAGITGVQRDVWLDTYVNEEHGITTEDIAVRFKDPEKVNRWKKTIVEKKTTCKILVAKDEGTVVGFCIVVKGGTTNKLGAVYLLPTYQGKGLGKKLITQTLDWLGNEKDITVDVVAYNKKAIQVYEHLGFTMVGPTPAQDVATLASGKIMPEVRMVKRAQK